MSDSPVTRPAPPPGAEEGGLPDGVAVADSQSRDQAPRPVRPAPPPTETLREAREALRNLIEKGDLLLPNDDCGLEDWQHDAGCWVDEHGEALVAALSCVEALVAAVREDVDDYLEWRSIPGNEHKSTPVMDNLVAAYRPFSVAVAERAME